MLAQRHVTVTSFAPVSPEASGTCTVRSSGNLLPAQTNPVLYGGGPAFRVLCLLIACFPSSVPFSATYSSATLGTPARTNLTFRIGLGCV